MRDLICVKSAELLPVMKDVLNNGAGIRLTVTGMSMYPFLRENIDSVELSPAVFSDISRGDIVLIIRRSRELILHRVVRKEESCFFIIGDAQSWVEGPLYPDQLIAVTTAVWHRDRRIPCTSMLWKMLSVFWLYLLPYRGLIIRVCRYLKRLMLPELKGRIKT